MIRIQRTLLATAALMAAGSASAAIVLDFEKIAPHPNGNNVFIQGYYNGGTASNGNSGTNYGIGFSSNSLLICLNTPGVTCSNTSRGGLAPNSAEGALFFLSGADSIMNVASGFTTGFSFYYAAANVAGSVSVYDGLNGTGSLLATLALPTNTTGCGAPYNAGFCPFTGVGVGFNGTAKSVSFAGVANQIVFDDITFGSITPGVPEPGTYALMALGLAAVGAVARRQRKG